VDSVEHVTHDTNLYCVSFPTGSSMQVPVGRHVSVSGYIDGKPASLVNLGTQLVNSYFLSK